MKRISVIGLAVAAMLLAVAAFGATSASATVLCKSAPASHVCPASDIYGVGTELSATLSTPFELKTSTLEVVDKCEVGNSNSPVTNAGGEGKDVILPTSLSLSSCTGGAASQVGVPNNTSLRWITGTHNGQAFLWPEMEFHMFGVSCPNYQIGGPFEFKGGQPARWVFSNSVVEKTSGSHILCPTRLFASGEFTVNGSQPVYVEEK